MRIIIKLNTSVKSPDLFIPVLKTIRTHQQNHAELLSKFLSGYKCVDSTSMFITHITNLTLTSGTSWNIENPPKQPTFFLSKILFKSKNKNVVDRYNYVRFLSICEAINDIAYDLIEKIESRWDYWNIEDKEDITPKDITNTFNDNEKGIIEKGRTKCFSVEYELVPNSTGELQIVGCELKYSPDKR